MNFSLLKMFLEDKCQTNILLWGPQFFYLIFEKRKLYLNYIAKQALNQYPRFYQ